MRFVCDSCRAQYMISDDKIGPKGVKVRCKKCGHTITVRPAGAPAAKDSASESSTSESPASSEASKGSDSAATMPATLGTPPEGGLFTDVEEDEIGAVFDQVLSSGTHKIPTEAANEAAAREASAENVRKLAEAEAEPDKDDAKSNAAAHEWYVAIDEKQVGPFTVEKVKDLWDRGEVGPDSLCWRSGFSDWIPLSETAELASVLAPRPSKPVIVAPDPVSGTTPTVSSGPVQSAFSAGKGARGEAGSAPASEEPVGWKPSAASVLASLVKEENDALSKPPPTPAPALGREPVSQSRLLDVPMPPPEPVSSPSLRGAEMPMAQQPMAAPMPYGQPQAPQYAQPAPMPYGQPQAPQYAQPMPAPYPPPGYPPAYPHPGAGQGGSKSKMGLFAGIAVGVLVVGGGAAAFFMSGGSGAGAAPTNPPVVAAAPAAAPTPPPVAPPPPVAAAQAAAPEAPPVNAAPPPGTEVAAAPTNTATAPAPTPPPEPPPTAVAAAPTPPPASPEPSKPSETLVAKVERPSSSRRTTSSSRREEPEPRPTSAPARAERPSSNDSDDDFDELFGTKKSSSSASKPAAAARPTAYVPPEPGGAMPDRLQQSDIMAVVLANKPAIIKCVNEQKKKDPSLSGKLVMRWTIETSGKTTAVSCRTDEFRSTYMATCITGLIKSWSFPRHKRKGEPIDFPFTF